MSTRPDGAPLIALSTASVFPQPIEAAFEMASDLGYDGVEVMVWTDGISQQPERVRELAHKYRGPVLSVHAPCLLLTQRVWGTDPVAKLERSAAAAAYLGADTVVLHPPFRWQRRYARGFIDSVHRIEDASGVQIAVENMFPIRVGTREVSAYQPGWDVAAEDYRHLTLDLSHTSVSQSDALDMMDRMGDRLAHLHLADGSGRGADEHLVPGHGDQPCEEVLVRLRGREYAGTVVIEVTTTGQSPEDQAAQLAESLEFARRHLGG